MTSNAIDFFATLGRKPGQFSCKAFKNLWADDGSTLTPSEIWNDAITDIAVLTKGDHTVDESWTILNTSLDGEELQLPYIAIKRRSTTHRLDHITKIRFVQPGEPTPVGFELLRNSISGAESSQLRQLGYLAIKRADTSSVMFIQGESMIDDIVCLMRPATTEELPAGYVMVEKTAYPNNATAAAAAAGQPYFALGYHVRSPVGLCDLRYESATLDRFPAKDYKGLELPVNELPMFAFPNDLRLTYGSLNRFPLPVFFTFVFTDANGGHLYAACLRFYEVVPYADLLPVFNQVYGESTHKFEVLPGSEIFCPKVICVVSKRPFYRAMRRFLRQIYSLSLSFLSCPLEYFIASLVNQVPLPVEGGRTFHVMLDSALISPTSRPMAPIVFELPISRFFPHMDLDFAGPLRCLSIDNLLTVFTLMLREAKLLFVCSSNTLLTDAMESLRMLLFPMSWASCFVSRLPDALTGLLEAPGGFMVGIHVMEDNADSDKRPGSSRTHDWYVTATKNFIKNIHVSHTLMPGTYVVDLSANGVYQYDGKTTEPLSVHHMDLITKTLPLGPKQRLKLKLQKIASEYRIGPQTVGFEEFDSAFDFQSQDDSQVTAKKWEEFPTLEVRDCFMAFMIDLLGNYPKYIIPPIEDMTVDTYRTFKEEFSVSDYLEDSDPGSRHCLELLMESQMFAVLLQERSEGNHYAVVFFEQCSNLMRQLGLSAGGHGSGHAKGPNVIPELPAPIFELLEAESRWSALSKIMQQQILNTSMFSTASSAVPSTKQHGPSTPTPHPHQLSMITLASSGISPLRTSTPVKVVQPVVNEKLSDLLTMHKIMKSIDVFKHVALDDVGNNALLNIARQELDRKEELQLQNYDMGPLIIPGPVLKANGMKAVSSKQGGGGGSETDDGSGSSSPAAEEEGEKVTFSYATWPDFKKDLFEAAQENIHPRLKEVRSVRLYANEKMNKRMLMFIRSPSERLAFEHEGKLHNKIKLDAHEEVSAIISGILDVASISIMMLAGRVLHLKRSTADVLQMLGIVAQIESVGLTHCINESVWRSILACCAAGGGDLMRKIACVVFEGINSVNVNPDALTYGQYIQALASKKINKAALPKGAVEAPEDPLLDQYLYLEEIGHTWFLQRSALIEKAQVELEYSSIMGNSVSPVAMFQKSMGSSNHSNVSHSSRRQSWIMSNSPMGLDNVNSKRIVVKSTTTAAQYTGDLLALKKSFGLFSFLRPNEVVGVSSLRAVSTLLTNGDGSAEELGAECTSRLDSFYAHAAAVPAQPGKRRLSDVRGRNTSRESNLSAAAPSTTTTASLSSAHSVASPERNPQVASRSSAGHNHPQTEHSPMGMMSRIGSQFMGAASSAATSAASAVKSSTASSSASAAKPPSEGWSITKRFFGSKPSVQNTPPPSSSNSAAVAPSLSPPPRDAKGVTTVAVDDESTGLRGSFLKFMPSTLNFDDEEGSDEDNDSQPSTDNPAPTDASAAPKAAEVDAADAVPATEPVASPSETSVSEEAKIGTAEQHDPIVEPEKQSVEEHHVLTVDHFHDAETAAVEEAFTRASLVEDENVHQTKKTNIVDLQSKLLGSFERDFRQSGSVVGIHSRSECSCGYAMLDEEIMGVWCKYQSEDIHTSVVLNSSGPGSTAQSSKKGSDGKSRLDRALSVNSVMKGLLAAHALLCPQCGLECTPTLDVNQYSLDSTDEHQERTRPYSKYVISTWSTTVNHMSPFALRFELEEVVLKFGETVCEAEWLHSHYPDLYWGVVWYANRFGVPTGLLNAGGSVGGEVHLLDNAVIVGWSSDVVKLRAFQLLTGQTSVKSSVDLHDHRLQSEAVAGVSGLELIDLFPHLTQEEVVILTELVEDKLDGSPAGMRAAMLELAGCKNLFLEAKDTQKKGPSNARIIYLTLLSLSFLFNKTKLIGNPTGPDVVRILTREFAFDKLFMDTISWTLSKADFLEMKTTESELVKCVATKEVQAARIGFGFHF